MHELNPACSVIQFLVFNTRAFMHWQLSFFLNLFYFTITQSIKNCVQYIGIHGYEGLTGGKIIIKKIEIRGHTHILIFKFYLYKKR